MIQSTAAPPPPPNIAALNKAGKKVAVLEKQGVTSMSLSVMYSMTAVLLLQKDLILYEVTLNDVFPSICLYALLARQFNFKLEA